MSPLLASIFSYQGVVQAAHPDWISEIDTADLDSYFSSSILLSGTFADVRDESIETGIKTDLSDNSPFLRVEFEDEKDIKSIFVFTDKTMTAGDLNILLHDASGDLISDPNLTLPYNTAMVKEGGGGVLTLDTIVKAISITITCDGCVPSMSINMFRVWADTALLENLSPQYYY